MKPLWILAKWGLYLLFNGMLLAAALWAYVLWSEHTGNDVIPVLRQNAWLQKIFNHEDAFALVRLIDTDNKFPATWDFNSGVALSSRMFQPQTMFGEEKYTYRPDTGIYNAVLWYGLGSYKLAFASTPAVDELVSRNRFFHKVYFRTDGYGFKPTGFPWAPGAKTVFFLGDSFTEGLWVSPEETFAHRFGELARGQWPSLSIINLGVNGYSALEMDWMLETYAPQFEPSLVVANLFLNDVIADYYRVLRNGDIPEENYQALFLSLDRMRLFCEARGIRLAVAVIPAKEQFGEFRGSTRFHERVQAWAEEHRITYLDPREDFQAAGPDALYFGWDPHFSPAGHAEYAAFLFRQLSPIFSN